MQVVEGGLLTLGPVKTLESWDSWGTWERLLQLLARKVSE